MHFELLIEDQSGKIALECIVSKFIREDTYRIHHYRGIGRVPKNLKPKTDARKRILLDQLPKLLQGYGRVPSYDERYVIVICDLDNRDKLVFLEELTGVLNACNPKPEACFCLAIEELEAWFLGDLGAIRSAYPLANNKTLENYINDSICGTWEVLANAIYKGGSKALAEKGYQVIGEQKCRWAEAISPHMDLDANKSPSFQHFYATIRSRTTDH